MDKLFVIRHATAAGRELEIIGVQQMIDLAEKLKPHLVGLPPDECFIYHSPVIRAQKSAAILANMLRLPKQELPALDTQDWLGIGEYLEKTREAIEEVKRVPTGIRLAIIVSHKELLEVVNEVITGDTTEMLVSNGHGWLITDGKCERFPD